MIKIHEGIRIEAAERDDSRSVGGGFLFDAVDQIADPRSLSGDVDIAESNLTQASTIPVPYKHKRPRGCQQDSGARDDGMDGPASIVTFNRGDIDITSPHLRPHPNRFELLPVARQSPAYSPHCGVPGKIFDSLLSSKPARSERSTS
ncbi:MAG: hypothetical protein IPJ07_09140 [Acidobacteria bacterium]|nr:hypothetical protein [Acidobacteriota bacterium]